MKRRKHLLLKLFELKVYFQIEAAKLQRYERILNHAHRVLAISMNDAEYLSQRFEQVEYVTAFHPNESIQITQKAKPYALYHGNLAVAENQEAVKTEVEENVSFDFDDDNNLASEEVSVPEKNEETRTIVQESEDSSEDSELETRAKDEGLGLWSASPPLERPGDLMVAVGGEEPWFLLSIFCFGMDQDNRTGAFLAK